MSGWLGGPNLTSSGPLAHLRRTKDAADSNSTLFKGVKFAVRKVVGQREVELDQNKASAIYSGRERLSRMLIERQRVPANDYRTALSMHIRDASGNKSIFENWEAMAFSLRTAIRRKGRTDESTELAYLTLPVSIDGQNRDLGLIGRVTKRLRDSNGVEHLMVTDIVPSGYIDPRLAESALSTIYGVSFRHYQIALAAKGGFADASTLPPGIPADLLAPAAEPEEDPFTHDWVPFEGTNGFGLDLSTDNLCIRVMAEGDLIPWDACTNSEVPMSVRNLPDGMYDLTDTTGAVIGMSRVQDGNIIHFDNDGNPVTL
jgi:hypothetical protein